MMAHRIFSKLYAKVMQWVQHPHAPYYLAGLSFAEAAFFPIPPDVMLAPMALAQPQRAWRYATLTTVSSVTGGVVGYLLGFLLITGLYPLLIRLGYEASYQQVVSLFKHWGVVIIILAGFTPIPYKVFTIAAGALHMFLPAFIITSIIGRSLRFFLVASLVIWGGSHIERILPRIVDYAGWACVGGFVVYGCWYYW